MNVFHLVSYPLFLIAALEIVLGIIVLRNRAGNSKVQKVVIALAFLSACFSLISAIMYTRASLGLSIDLAARANWIGWFTVPAALQLLYYIKDERSRTGDVIGFILYPVWAVIFGLCLFTDLIVRPGYSVIPFINSPGPLEAPARLFGSLLAIWLLFQAVKLKKEIRGIKKAQLNYFFHGIILFGGGASFTAGFMQLFGGFGFEPGLASFFSLPWVALTYYAMTRYRLFDIRIILSRFVSAILIVLIFALMQTTMLKILTPVLGQFSSIVLSFAIIGGVFFGTRISRKMQSWVQQLLLQDKYNYQKVLMESVKAVTGILSLNELLDFLINSMKQSLDVDNADLVLKKKDGRYLRHQVESLAATVDRAGGLDDAALAEWLAAVGHAVVREELESETAPDIVSVREAMLTMGAELLVPLVYKGDVKGFMVLGQKGNRDPYLQSDIDVLELLAGHAVIALENAQLYEDARQAKGTMRESEAKFRTLAETAAMGIFIHQGGNFLYANKASEIIGGYTLAEYLTMDFMSLVHPEFIDLVKSRARQRLSGNSDLPTQYEFKIMRKDGEERWVLMTAGISEFEGKPSVIGTLIDITARRKAEDEREEYYRQLQSATKSLQESERRFRTLTETTAAGILIEEGGRIVYANPAAEESLGFTADEYLAMQSLDLIHPDYRDLMRSKTNQPLLGLSLPAEFELKMLNKKGEQRCVNVSMGAIRFGGKPSTIMTLFDVTDRKKAEEERYQMSLLIESSSDFIGMAAMDGRVLFVNTAGRKLIGLPGDQDVKKMSLMDYFQPEDRPLLAEELLPNDAWRGEFRLRHAGTGASIPVDMYSFIVFDEKTGVPMARATVIRDIADFKRTREERERYYQQLQEATHSLRESEEKFRTLAETTTAAIFIHQGQKLVYANPAGTRMTGYTNDELLREDFWFLIHPDYQDLVKERGQMRIRGHDAPSDYEYKFIKKNGEECWVSMTAGFIEFGGKPAIIATLFDITGWKRAEEAKVKFYEESVRQYQERIEEEKRHRIEKEKILMDLHDGIGGITTNISILSELAMKAEDQKAATRLLSTISTLSREGISEIRGFMHSLDSTELNWRTLAAELRKQGSNMVETHNIRFIIEADLGECEDQPGSLTWVNIFKIYKEALTNVIKHSKASEVAVDFRVCQDGVHLSVRDNGVGSQGSGPGGRGLSHMKIRAEDIGGAVSVMHERGTEVSLSIPLPLKYPATGMAI